MPADSPSEPPLIILGASGRTGAQLTRLAAERGHPVTALIRPNAEYAPPPGVVLRRGEATDTTDIRALILAAPPDTVILSCVGQRRASLWPWSRLLSPPNLVTTVTRHLIAATEDRHDLRLIWISAGGVGESYARTSPLIRPATRMGRLGDAYRDLNHAESLLADSHLASLAVRPVTLRNGAPTSRAGIVPRYGAFSTIRRSDLAAWMLAQAEQPNPALPRAVMLAG